MSHRIIVLSCRVEFGNARRRESVFPDDASHGPAALKGMLPANACVRREGEKREISAADLVPGNIVRPEAGDRVPVTDALSSRFMQKQTNPLTGKSRPVGKNTTALRTRNAVPGGRVNIAYTNTMVTHGLASIDGRWLHRNDTHNARELPLRSHRRLPGCRR